MKINKNSKKSFSFILVNILVLSVFASDSTRVEYKILKPEEQHSLIMQTSLQVISMSHYKKIPVDDAFSSKVFDNYLKHLDGGKQFLTAADVKDMEKFRSKFDDILYTNDIQPVFDIYNLLMKRTKERIDYSLALIKNDFDYTVNDSFMFDREDAKWCSDTSELNKLWYRKIKYECLTIRATGKDFKSYSETIRKRYENLDKQVSKTKSEDVFYYFMNSLTELFDPHTNYFSPRVAEDFTQSMSLSLEGIGAQLQTDGEYTKITQIIKGGPADSSKKLFANDKIIGVAQGNDSEMVNVIDWRIDDVVALIRGKKGTTVRLEIIPATDAAKTKIISLVRDKIKLESQASKSKMKEVNINGKKLKIGVITIPTFYIDFAAQQRGDKNYTSTTRDVKRLITELRDQKADGIIIDLRNNGGGSLQEAIELTGLFIKTGPVVQVKDASGNVKVEKDNDESILYEGPLTVLVNRFSASASEIFSAAIQDYGRGIIVGERTYGKGTVQNIIDLNNVIAFKDKKLGQVKITLAKFYRINGGTTQHKGVTPDILFPGVYDNARFGEDASPFALNADSIKPSDYTRVGVVDKIKIPLLNDFNKTIKNNPEYKYLMEDIAYTKKMDANNYVSINEKTYKEETRENDAVKKKRDEERKALKKEKEESKEETDDSNLILSEGEIIIANLVSKKK